MLRIALPNKGSLSEKAVKLVKEAGYKCRRWGKELLLVDSHHNIEFYFLRPKDIAVYVNAGFIDMGVTGRDLMVDSLVDIHEILPLSFGGSKFRYAVPSASTATSVKDFGGKTIACSYPNIVKKDLKANGIEASVVKLDGAVEISIKLGVADVIADVVESGRTLKEAGLKVIGDTIMVSEAILVSKNAAFIEENPEARTFVQRLQGILVAREYVMIEYDVPKIAIDQACDLTAGIESPTVADLRDPDWCSVKAMIKSKSVNTKMDELSAIGARGIIITEIKTCRL